MTAFLQTLSRACREHPRREKIVVVPSLAIGHQIGDAIARGGTPWINLRFETVRTIADAVAGLDLAREGRSVQSRAQALALVERACDRVIGDGSYFAALRGSPGLYRAIHRSIDDLRLSGAGPSLPQEAFEDARKAADLARIIEAYEEELASRRLVDRCGVVRRAIELLEAGQRGPWSEDALWIASDEVELSEAESGLIALASRGTARVRVAGQRDDGASLPQLTGIRFVDAAGEENEIRAVFRTILDGGRFDDAELIYTTADPYLPLAFELCAEYGIEATFAEGVAVPFTAPGQACLAFLRWCGNGWTAADLEEAARAGSIRTGDDDLAPGVFARVLRTASIGWGRERYRPQIESLAAGHESDAANEELSEERRERARREAVRARAALNVIDRLLEITTELAGAEEDGEIRSSVLARAALAFVTEFTWQRNERDGMAHAALAKMFRELAELPDARIGLADAAARLADAVLSLYTGASNPRPGHLHVTPLRAAAWSGRPRLFLTGMGETHFPGAGLQDPIVLDGERAKLNERIAPRQLAMRGESPLRAAERLHRCLARGADAQWTISFSSLSLADQRDSFPANDLLDIYRAAAAAPSASWEDLSRHAARSSFVEPSIPLGASEWWLGQRFHARRPGYFDEVRAEYRWLDRGEEAEQARCSLELTAWDGVVPIEVARVDPRLSGREVSASQIERMASCPYGWFLRHVLRIEPPEELVRDPEVWLEPRHLGSLLHELFETTMTDLCARRAAPSLEHRPLMQQHAEEALARWRAKIPPPHEAAYRRQRDEVLRTCETFLRLEAERAKDAEAMYFEAPFGFPDAASHPIGMVEPLVIPLSKDRSVRVRGRIDRVDRMRDGTWAVWDYKTGGTYDWDGAWTFDRGRAVQHAIYARALGQMLRARGIDGNPVVSESGYVFPTPKGEGARYAKTTGPGALEKVLNLAFDVIASGFFPHPEDEGDCRFCDFATICGGASEAAARAKAKMEANQDAAIVKKWRRLGDVV